MPPKPGFVRAVEPRDCAAWIAMRRALWPDEDAAELAHEATTFVETGKAFGLVPVLVSDSEAGGLTGFIELNLRDYADGCMSSPVPYVEGWYVQSAVRGSGVGAALIEAVEAWSVERGYTELASDALLHSLVSELAHKALGFEEVERAIRFRKHLKPLRDFPP